MQDISGALFCLINEIVFTYSYFVVFLIPEQYALIRRETGEELYSISAFYVSKIIILVRFILKYLALEGVVVNQSLLTDTQGGVGDIHLRWHRFFANNI